MSDARAALLDAANSEGFEISFISTRHLKALQSDIDGVRGLDHEIEAAIGSYLDDFHYELPSGFPSGSIITIAVPQPITKITFMYGQKRHPVILPPTYQLNTSFSREQNMSLIEGITNMMTEVLAKWHYSLEPIHLPRKLTAVRSGLGKYGRNNLCYVYSRSSFHWLGTFISDLPCDHDSWVQATIMDACTNCSLCAVQCPSGAIPDDRFIYHPSKCITLYNEKEADFPMWMDRRWHNSIIGCMRCQMICPVNRKVIEHVEESDSFEADETDMILSGAPLVALPDATKKKLSAVNLLEEYALLARNLDVLVR